MLPPQLITSLIAVGLIALPTLSAKPKKFELPPLTEQGQAAASAYTAEMEALKSDIIRQLEPVDPARKAAFLKARQTEEQASATLKQIQHTIDQIRSAKALVDHAKGKWIGSAQRGIQEAQTKLQQASTAAERTAAENALAHWQQNLKQGEQALQDRQAKLQEIENQKPQLEKKRNAAQEFFEKAQSDTQNAFKQLNLTPLLSKPGLDAKLAKYSIMKQATANQLARFAQQGKLQQQQLDQLLLSGPLLVEMAVADGASGHRYGEAMQIYYKIWQSSDKVAEGPLPRLALAISLEHAVPVKQRNAIAQLNAPATVDPVKRYLHYEKAFLSGELDPAFASLSVWEYRMVVNGEEPDAILSWGREMLRNYRPDHITNSDYRWRYVASVRSDIPYGSQDNQYDQDELQFFQNILMNGGVCGRRAFFGRFILRAFGIPTTARPSRGHAALAHWTPDGWVVCLGGGWGAGWTKTRYDRDLDFLANTQARATGPAFMQVKRAQWLGDLMDEPQVFGLHSRKTPNFWYAVSLYTQLDLIQAAEATPLAAVGQDIAEANETKEHIPLPSSRLKATDREISISETGTITIPACATSQPRRSTGKILFLDSFLGGKQLHYSRSGRPQTFTYSLHLPQAGRYALRARVVTPSWKQSLDLSINGSDQTTHIPLPFTVGSWKQSQPVTIKLAEGPNRLTFSRQHPKLKGVTIKEFTLTPLN